MRYFIVQSEHVTDEGVEALLPLITNDQATNFNLKTKLDSHKTLAKLFQALKFNQSIISIQLPQLSHIKGKQEI